MLSLIDSFLILFYMLAVGCSTLVFVVLILFLFVPKMRKEILDDLFK